jgi:hypothetical protein
VTQTAAVILHHTQAALSAPGGGGVAGPAPLGAMEIFCVIIAAAVHDLGHPGVNNDYLVRTRDKTAIVYNDRWVLGVWGGGRGATQGWLSPWPRRAGRVHHLIDALMPLAPHARAGSA